MTWNKKNQGKKFESTHERTRWVTSRNRWSRDDMVRLKISRHYASEITKPKITNTHTTIIIYSYLKSFSDPPPCLVFLTSPLVHPGDYSPKSQTDLNLDFCFTMIRRQFCSKTHTNVTALLQAYFFVKKISLSTQCTFSNEKQSFGDLL